VSKVVGLWSPYVLEREQPGVVVSVQFLLDVLSARLMMGNNNFTSPFSITLFDLGGSGLCNAWYMLPLLGLFIRDWLHSWFHVICPSDQCSNCEALGEALNLSISTKVLDLYSIASNHGLL